jgi:hypothetical protein
METLNQWIQMNASLLQKPFFFIPVMILTLWLSFRYLGHLLKITVLCLVLIGAIWWSLHAERSVTAAKSDTP